jgi:hypothetical protein
VADIELVDSTWVGAPVAAVAAAVGDGQNWPLWWPGLAITVTEARGRQGMRWRVRGSGVAGDMEVWLQPALDGVLVHFLMWLDAGHLGRRRRARVERMFRRQAKRAFWALGDELNADRRARLAGARTPE